MKKIKSAAFAIVSSALVIGSVVSCSLNDFTKLLGGSTGVSKPTLSFKDIAINSLDTEGVTFKCNYSVTNPYNVSVSISKVAADITCNGNAFTSLTANEGVSLAAKGTKSNTFNFKVPYDSLINFAKSYSASKTSLPFNVKGTVGLDLSRVTSLTNKTLSLPFNKTVNAPVVKPSFTLSSPKLVLPTISEIVSAFKNSGMSATQAAKVAANLVAGKSVDSNVFDNVNLNMKLNFNLGVSNSGSSAWSYLVKSCAIKTGDNSVISLDTANSAAITSSSGTVPVTATLNTLKFSKFIVQIINKSGTNPTFSLDSGISFPDLGSTSYPLSYSKAIPLSSFGLTKS